MEPILLLGGLAALLYWLTSSKSSSGGGGGGVRTTDSPDFAPSPSGAPVAVQTTDAYAQGVATGRLDAGDSMDATVSSGNSCGSILGKRWDGSKDANWQQGYHDGFVGTLSDHGWSADGTKVCMPAGAAPSSGTTAPDDSANIFESGKSAGVSDAQTTIGAGVVQQPAWNASSSKGNTIWTSGYRSGFDSTLAADGYAVDDSGNLYALDAGSSSSDTGSTDWMGDSL